MKKTKKIKMAAFTLLACAAVLAPAAAAADPVQLQVGTATFSQQVNFPHSPDQAIDGVLGEETGGWAIARYDGFGGTSPETAVWETASDVDAEGLTVRLYFYHLNYFHMLGRFRLAVTTADRSAFADGQDADGLIGPEAIWTVLPDPIIEGPPGMTFTTLPDGSVLAAGAPPEARGVYTVRFETLVLGVTGIRLEALEDPSLPGGNGPGTFDRNGNFVLTEIALDARAIRRVGIDVKPGDFPNNLNPGSQGVIPVAVLTGGAFDAATVDPATVTFGPTGTEAAPAHAVLEDVDGDGDLDLLLHFWTQDTGIACGATAATLRGSTFDGTPILGIDSVRTIACR